MSLIDNIEKELLAEQEQMQESLNLKPKKAKKTALKKKPIKKATKRKVQLHVTIPEELKTRIEARAEQEHRSLAVMVELLIEEGL